MKTFAQKPADVKREWYLLDAAGAPFGRVATLAAGLLIGKGKPTVTPHTDGGDFVVIINSDKLVATGGKSNKKTHYRHSGYPGGIYSRSLQEQLELDSTAVIVAAVRGMLPVNKLRKQRLARLKVYAGGDHNHVAQKPTEIKLGSSK